MTTKAQKVAAELEAANQLIAELQAAQGSTEPSVELTVEQVALQSGANGYFIVIVAGVEIAIRKDTLRYQKNWEALNLIENLEGAIMDPKTVADVDFDEQPTTYKLCVGKEKADAEASKRTVCGVEVSTARPSTQAGNGSTFTRTQL
ncbi:MAG: hypothetical protein DRQ89_15620 [Epsilonproteobacteria bacterium]|nr:MAG: hypothetical protein DRQ89_15620 [Campylobacterota bacterium]